jgi:tRNA 2-thiouridine synthesizing protein E
MNRFERLVFDQDGFLANPATWDESVAERLAEEDGLGALHAEQRAMLRALRDHYFKTGGVPALSHLCLAQHFDRHCMTDLFPSTREAWRLAGLPNPGEEAKAYM